MLADIRVNDFAPRRCSRLPEFLRRRPKALLGEGIGRELLRRFLQEADASGVREIYGSVTGDDLQRSPFLLGWYERHGFQILEPDAECIPQAIKKIMRQR
jgi:N-acetylglutamate synthase-like GNAT family acetyltransferase